jgi:putative spermidine/putrescine transport system ATP-binding protein
VVSAALVLSGLTKRFHSVVAVNNVSLTVGAGEFVALLGPSGSGKTTVLRLLAGFQLPTSGEIIIAGRNVSGLAPSERNIGMVFQHYALFPHMSVARNIEYGLRMHGWDSARRQARVRALLAMIRLEHAGDRLPHQLSGGQQQRVAIARALAYSPSLLLMDEPLGALDRALRMEMAEEIRRIHRTLGTTFIYVTHDRDEAMTLADRVLVMHQGRIEADGAPQQLFERPQSAFVAGFFSGMNVLAGAVMGDAAALVAISPQTILFSPPLEPHACLRASIADSLFLGEKRLLLLNVGGVQEPLRAEVAAGADVPPIGPDTDIYVRRTDILKLSR